ncbi:VOC family protein [Tsukamurella sp. NPDC003166]|uniref:VOC family protein n=1 Tax=Tsukamurella sp. NPDC003166 TaxID=3154444 RepID=UPI0033B4B30C
MTAVTVVKAVERSIEERTMKVSFQTARFVVGDMARSLAFYEGALGMTVVGRSHYSDPDIVEVTLADGDGRPSLILLAGEEAPVHSGMSTHGPVVFFVDDANAANDELKAGGYELAFDPPVGIGPAVAAMAVDPDGYQIELVSISSDIDLIAAQAEAHPDAEVHMPHPVPWIHQAVLR